ncbi:MAG: hypothetical protein AB8I08_33420 [Sandaracinaceae bacterium]
MTPDRTMNTGRPTAPEPRARRIVAKSVFRELKTSGYSRSDIVAFATEMLSLVSTDLQSTDMHHGADAE